MKYKFEYWHLLVAVVVLFGVAHYFGLGFLGALTGICHSEELNSSGDIISAVSLWKYGGADAQIMPPDPNDPGAPTAIFWGNMNLFIVIDQYCGNVLAQADYQVDHNPNITKESSFEGPTQVFKYYNMLLGNQPTPILYVWCNSVNKDVVMATTNVALKDMYFEQFYVCTECEAGVNESETCDTGSTIVTKQCTENGTWSVIDSCPVIEVPNVTATTTGTGGAGVPSGSIKIACDFPGEYWDSNLRKCTGGCTLNSQCPSKSCDLDTYSCNPVVVEEQSTLEKYRYYFAGIGLIILGLGYWLITKIK